MLDAFIILLIVAAVGVGAWTAWYETKGGKK